ncbi:MAG: NrfD/PsrC family molybdoenzyme membrane anchor subunit, partial [Thermoanaerobaculia bacterium]
MTPQLFETVTTRANPQIDPSLHVWGWQIVLYLFLGGLVAGIFILTAALELRSGEKARSGAVRMMPFVALVLLSFGMLFLWLDLEHRFWAWRFYAVFRPTSPMSWGAWILVLIYPAGLLLGLGSLDEAQREGLRSRTPEALRGLLAWLTEISDAHRRTVLVASVLAGVALGLYTGLLLGTMPSRLAWNSALLGPLFLASGISTGAASLLLLKLDD